MGAGLNPRVRSLALSPSLNGASDLPLLRDPFDALICAAALDLGLPLLSRDQLIAATPRIKTIW
jgi:PIN domain nuclease of toxin-antitoxin system